ncbi:tetratricopeptide repeat protein [Wenzhouxiangella marina]|uniref:Uncharacterized protein n=1 Tax=Wenzhouxiangella marina TaxID=1579979 RepID=A0A0K0XT51_9GAMM|nr:tetratricopeptide repeat protein [Wenzhouxiangella marina]AKS40796.1 hypothetical protein WM2015_413 [Wenzhouxiangella marina]MBB6087669.1 putative TPR repeat methyltransferase [Wenzhouxiangella marina]
MSEALLQRAVEAYRAGRAEDAEALARQVSEAEPQNEQAVLMCSGLMLHRQANDEAERLLRRSLEQGLASPAAQVNLALCLSRRGDQAGAAELARAAARSQPELVSAWNAFAAALLELERFDEAERVLSQALEIHPEHPALSLLMGHVHRAQQRDDAAESQYRTFDRQGKRLLQQAEALALSGRLVEAEHQYRQLLAIQPRLAAAHGGLGRVCLRLGKREEALGSLETAIRLDPDDSTSRHFLSVARGQPVTRADPGYVRALFDDYAEEFETDLTDKLGYRIPGEIATALLEANADLSRVLDLGCGTGLMAAALAGRFGLMDGVDLSPRMLALAEQRGAYRHLVRDEVVRFLSRSEDRWTTVLAADVLVYVGALEALAESLAARLEPGGWFAFSIERSEAEDCRLNPETGRFQHRPEAVDRLFEAAGFQPWRWIETTIRQERDARIPGAIGLFRRRSD